MKWPVKVEMDVLKAKLFLINSKVYHKVLENEIEMRFSNSILPFIMSIAGQLWAHAFPIVNALF